MRLLPYAEHLGAAGVQKHRGRRHDICDSMGHIQSTGCQNWRHVLWAEMDFYWANDNVSRPVPIFPSLLCLTPAADLSLVGRLTPKRLGWCRQSKLPPHRPCTARSARGSNGRERVLQWSEACSVIQQALLQLPGHACLVRAVKLCDSALTTVEYGEQGTWS